MVWPTKPKKIPAIKEVMTAFPFAIGSADSIDKAEQMMETHRIHHLPVMDEGNPTGVISHRDLLRTRDQHSQGKTKTQRVSDVPREEAFVVDLSAPLDRVLREMGKRRLGAALVVKDDRLAGIFTLTDACQCFAESLRQQFPDSDGNEAA